MRAYRRAFIPSLAMGAVAGALSAAMPSLSLTFHLQGLDVHWAILSTSSYWTQLALLFALMYVVGRGIDLRNTYGGVIISLFIGSATGRYLGYAIGYFASSSGREVFTAEMAVASMYTSLQPVFTGFSALALAYLRNLHKGRTRT